MARLTSRVASPVLGSVVTCLSSTGNEIAEQNAADGAATARRAEAGASSSSDAMVDKAVVGRMGGCALAVGSARGGCVQKDPLLAHLCVRGP
eukprot:4197841-Pyramimonas_sp.AAC.1